MKQKIIYKYEVEWINVYPESKFDILTEADSRQEADKYIKNNLSKMKEDFFNHKILSTTIYNTEDEINETKN
jgi:hypothetical protein